MHNKIAGLCGVLGLVALALPASAGGAGPFGIEKSLIGVRMLQSYKDVMRKFGPPTRVYRNDETVGLIEAYDNKGNPTGGILGFSDSLAALGGGGAPGGPPAGLGGGPGGMSNPKSGMFGRPGFGGPGGPPAGMRGGGMTPGMAGLPPGKGGMAVGGGGAEPGQPGMGGPGGMRGGFGGGMPPGANTASGDVSGPSPRIGSYVGGETFEDAGGFKWVYFYPKEQLLYEFIFNKDGRVEIILERGRGFGAPTSRGIRLGSSERAVLDTYGWPDNIEDEGVSFGFSYILKHHVEFTLTRDKVTGIAVFLREDQRIRFQQNGAQQMAGQMGGRPGMGGPGGLPGFPGGAGGMAPGKAGMFGGGRPGMMPGRPGGGGMAAGGGP